MNKKTEKQIIFLLLLVSIIFFSIPQIMPWNEFSENNIKASWFAWGVTVTGTNSGYATGLYPSLFNDYIGNINKIPLDSENTISTLKTIAIGCLFLFLTWLLSIITIIFSAVVFYYLYNNKEDKMKKWLFSASFTSLAVLIIWYISMNFMIIIPMHSTTFGNANFDVSWSFGYLLFLIGFILVTSVLLKDKFIKFSNRVTEE